MPGKDTLGLESVVPVGQQTNLGCKRKEVSKMWCRYTLDTQMHAVSLCLRAERMLEWHMQDEHSLCYTRPHKKSFLLPYSHLPPAPVPNHCVLSIPLSMYIHSHISPHSPLPPSRHPCRISCLWDRGKVRSACEVVQVLSEHYSQLAQRSLVTGTHEQDQAVQSLLRTGTHE